MMIPNEIIEIFDKYNIDIQLCFVEGQPVLDFTCEDLDGNYYEVDCWEDRIKSYTLESFNRSLNNV